MENNKRGRDSKKGEGTKPEKRSTKSINSGNKPFGRKPASTDKPFKKEKPSDYDKPRSSATGRGRKFSQSDEKPSGYRRGTQTDHDDLKKPEYKRERPSGSDKRRSFDRSDEKPSGYRRGAQTGHDDFKKPEYKRERPSGSDKRRSFDRGDEKPSGYRRSAQIDHDDFKKPEYKRERPSGSDKRRSFDRSDEKPSGYRRSAQTDHDDFKKPDYKRERPSGSDKRRSFDRSDEKPSGYKRSYRQDEEDHQPSRFRKERPAYEKPVARKPRPVKADPNAPIRLNKYIANAGVCSRREADKLIESGAVKVNGVIVTELGTKVSPADKVQMGDQTLTSEKLRYVLLNKPKGYITTSEDPFKRNTVMKLVEDACKERIYPVGRLDRNTTGLLLFTNDGELAKRLTHPRFGVRKIYSVELDKPLSKKDMESIAAGVELDGETIIIDEIAYVEYEKNKKIIGIELHSGQNRVVRRIFESFGYEVLKLDRVMIGSLTKKDLQRGFWRHLTDLEVRMLKRL